MPVAPVMAQTLPANRPVMTFPPCVNYLDESSISFSDRLGFIDVPITSEKSASFFSPGRLWSSRGSRSQGVKIITAQDDQGLSSVFWWASLFAAAAIGGAVLSIVEPGWIDVAIGPGAAENDVEWMVAGAHLVVAGFLIVVAGLEWRAAFPRRRKSA